MNFRRWNGGAESLKTQFIFVLHTFFIHFVHLFSFHPSVGLCMFWPLMLCGRLWLTGDLPPGCYLERSSGEPHCVKVAEGLRVPGFKHQTVEGLQSGVVGPLRLWGGRLGICALQTTILLLKHRFRPRRRMNWMFCTCTAVVICQWGSQYQCCTKRDKAQWSDCFHK